MDEDYGPAVAVWCGLIAAALAADVVLVRSRLPSLSMTAGATFARRIVVVYLAAHFLRRPAFLRRYDPLSLIARRIAPC